MLNGRQISTTSKITSWIQASSLPNLLYSESQLLISETGLTSTWRLSDTCYLSMRWAFLPIRLRFEKRWSFIGGRLSRISITSTRSLTSTNTSITIARPSSNRLNGMLWGLKPISVYSRMNLLILSSVCFDASVTRDSVLMALNILIGPGYAWGVRLFDWVVGGFAGI